MVGKFLSIWKLELGRFSGNYRGRGRPFISGGNVGRESLVGRWSACVVADEEKAGWLQQPIDMPGHARETKEEEKRGMISLYRVFSSLKKLVPRL